MPLTSAGFPRLALDHVLEDVLHGAAVGQEAGAHLGVGLLSPAGTCGHEAAGPAAAGSVCASPGWPWGPPTPPVPGPCPPRAPAAAAGGKSFD